MSRDERYERLNDWNDRIDQLAAIGRQAANPWNPTKNRAAAERRPASSDAQASFLCD
ncbi:MAG: hypothetical protein WD766_05465 [Gemmatimonadota bacterium]